MQTKLKIGMIITQYQVTGDMEPTPSSSPSYSARATVFLAVLAAIYTLQIARDVFLPVTLAFIFALLFSPLVERLQRHRVPRSLSAVAVIAASLGVLGSATYFLMGPASEWLAKVPEAMEAISRHTGSMQEKVADVGEATRSLETLSKAGGASDPRQVVITDPGWQSELFSGLRNGLIYSLLCIILLFFLLTHGQHLLSRFIETRSTFKDKERSREMARRAQVQMSLYLSTITMVNAGVAIATTLFLWLLGFPDPILWGAVAGLMRYVPYMGVALTAVLLAIVSAVSFDTVWQIVLPPLVFWGITVFVGQVIDPLVHGYRFQLNPIIVFVWIFFWGWLWGTPGVLLAVPLLTLFQLVCQYSERLAPIAHIISEPRGDSGETYVPSYPSGDQ